MATVKLLTSTELVPWTSLPVGSYCENVHGDIFLIAYPCILVSLKNPLTTSTKLDGELVRPLVKGEVIKVTI